MLTSVLKTIVNKLFYENFNTTFMGYINVLGHPLTFPIKYNLTN